MGKTRECHFRSRYHIRIEAPRAEWGSKTQGSKAEKEETGEEKRSERGSPGDQ